MGYSETEKQNKHEMLNIVTLAQKVNKCLIYILIGVIDFLC